ncbi:hypothetical protein EDB81DRAFT_921389 [Dactylonectria macrodidyma]|uniref:Uncharacterized protein n=1 Tax=Dactylonectria macrodidyma TaxID=307937 RepID=A0A9P9D711_9HYPO|nr:hypothetical protein EDB81DRAFT_921389 [Dactylonectria macrodidyma]
MALRRSKRITSQQHASSVSAPTSVASRGPMALTQASRSGGYNLRRNCRILRKDDAEAPRIQPMRAAKYQQMDKPSASHDPCEPHKPREQQHIPHELDESRELHTSRESRALRSTRECQARPVCKAQKGKDMQLQRLRQLASQQIDRAERIVALSEALHKHASTASTKSANMVIQTVQHPRCDSSGLEPRYGRRTSRTSARSLLLAQGDEKVKIDGVGYERSPTGPFPGELVSKGEVIQGDTRDYVIYRVLAKVSRDSNT